MKSRHLFITAILLAALATGCKKSVPAGDSAPASGANGSSSLAQPLQSAKQDLSNAFHSAQSVATDAWTNVKNGSTNAWDKTKEVAGTVAEDTKDVATNAWTKVQSWFQSDTNRYADYAYAQKEAFISQMQTNLTVLDQRIGDLSERAADAQDSVRASVQDKISALKGSRADLDKKLDDVKNATEDQWNDAKAAFQKSYNSVKDSMRQVWDSLAGKS